MIHQCQQQQKRNYIYFNLVLLHYCNAGNIYIQSNALSGAQQATSLHPLQPYLITFNILHLLVKLFKNCAHFVFYG